MLSMWTIYDSPTDYPNKFVARRFDVRYGQPHPTQSIIITPDLEALQDILQFEMRLTCIPRSKDDEPQIVETWL